MDEGASRVLLLVAGWLGHGLYTNPRAVVSGLHCGWYFAVSSLSSFSSSAFF